MKNMYEKIVASLIFSTKKSSYSKDIWPFTTVLGLSAAMTLNIGSIWMIIDSYFFPNFTESIHIKILNSKLHNDFLNFIIYIFLPICLFNYVCIFYNNRYVLIEQKYNKINHMKIGRIYFGLSWLGYFAIIFWIINTR